MAAKIVVIVSGETDRRSIPYLCRHYRATTDLFEVRKPPGNALTPEQAIRLIRATWYDLHYRGQTPEKFVVLIDADAHDPAGAAKPFEDNIRSLSDIEASKLVAVAVRHLEAWFFGDRIELRKILERDLGNVDPTKPDEIDDPKRHLINLLSSRGRVYTASVAEQIAARLDPNAIKACSPSFADFLEKLENGAPETSASALTA